MARCSFLALALTACGSDHPVTLAPDAGGSDAGLADAGRSDAGEGPGDDAGSDGGLDPLCVGRPARTFAGDVYPVIMQSCSGFECHLLNRTPEGAYSFLLGTSDCDDGRAIVAPGRPSASYVVDKLHATNLCGDGGGMPRFPNGTWNPLPDDQQQLFVDWICAGAAQ